MFDWLYRRIDRVGFDGIERHHVHARGAGVAVLREPCRSVALCAIATTCRTSRSLAAAIVWGLLTTEQAFGVYVDLVAHVVSELNGELDIERQRVLVLLLVVAV